MMAIKVRANSVDPPKSDTTLQNKRRRWLSKFPFQRYMVCWGKFYRSKIIGGEGGGGVLQATSALYSVKLCSGKPLSTP